MTKSQSPSARTNPALRALNTKSKMSKTVPNRHSNRTKWRKWLQTPDMNAEDDICKTPERVATTPYSPNWPGHLTEHLSRTKRCKNEKCKCKQKSNRAYECWVCGAEFPTTKATKRKYFSKNNPEPEGAKKKRRKKNELARAKKSPVSSLAIIGSSAPKKTPKVAAVQNEPVDNEDVLFSNVFNDPVMLDEPAMDLDNVPVAEISSLPKLSRGDSLTPLSENEPDFNYDSIPLPDFDSFQNVYDSDGGIEFDPIALFSGDIDFDLSV